MESDELKGNHGNVSLDFCVSALHWPRTRPLLLLPHCLLWSEASPNSSTQHWRQGFAVSTMVYSFSWFCFFLWCLLPEVVEASTLEFETLASKTYTGFPHECIQKWPNCLQCLMKVRFIVDFEWSVI